MKESRSKQFREALVVFICLLISVSCRRKPEPAVPVNEYKLTGQVVSLNPQHRLATIKHRKIEGWMRAMTMEFPVKDAADFQKLKPGVRLRASVFFRPADLEYWIANVAIIEEAGKQEPK